MSIMKVTVYKDGEIQKQFDAVSFGKAMKAALHLLCIEMERFVTHDKNIVVTTTHLSSNEWSVTVECADDEIYGVHIGRV